MTESMIWTDEDSQELTRLLKRVRDGRRFWPDEESFQLIHSIVSVPATEVAVVQDGRLLLKFRTFQEWPEGYQKPGWYIPGGYLGWTQSIRECCEAHLRKDLKAEYTRAGVDGVNLSEIRLREPTVIHMDKWMPGEHPFGCHVSLLCVTELESGVVPETDWLRWSTTPVATDVPLHEGFMEQVFEWIHSSDKEKEWLRRLQRKF